MNYAEYSDRDLRREFERKNGALLGIQIGLVTDKRDVESLRSHAKELPLKINELLEVAQELAKRNHATRIQLGNLNPTVQKKVLSEMLRNPHLASQAREFMQQNTSVARSHARQKAQPKSKSRLRKPR